MLASARCVLSLLRMTPDVLSQKKGAAQCLADVQAYLATRRYGLLLEAKARALDLGRVAARIELAVLAGDLSQVLHLIAPYDSNFACRAAALYDLTATIDDAVK